MPNFDYFSIERNICIFLTNSDIVAIALLKAISNVYVLIVWEPVFVYPEEYAVLEVFPKSSPPHPVYTLSLLLND